MSDMDSSVSEQMDTYSNKGLDESGDIGDWNPYGEGGQILVFSCSGLPIKYIEYRFNLR